MTNRVLLPLPIPPFIHAEWANGVSPDDGWVGVIHPHGTTVRCGHAHVGLAEARRCIQVQHPTYTPWGDLPLTYPSKEDFRGY